MHYCNFQINCIIMWYGIHDMQFGKVCDLACYVVLYGMWYGMI